MNCPNCGQELQSKDKFCPECGAAVATVQNPPAAEAAPPSAPETTPGLAEQARLREQRIAYVRPDYDPARDGRANASTHIAAAPSGNAGGQAQPPVSRPASTGMIVFAIVNMLCCGLGLGFFLGVTALVFCIMATSDQNPVEAERKIGIARILNLIGLVFIILQVVLFVVFFGAILLAVREEGPRRFFDCIQPFLPIG